MENIITSITFLVIMFYLFVFQLLGCGLLGVGLWLRFGVSAFPSVHPWATPATAVIALGTLVFVISFFGCCGACYKSKCMLLTVRKFYITYTYVLKFLYIYVLLFSVIDKLMIIDYYILILI